MKIRSMYSLNTVINYLQQMRSGTNPAERSSLTECWVGLVFCSSEMRGTRQTCTGVLFCMLVCVCGCFFFWGGVVCPNICARTCIHVRIRTIRHLCMQTCKYDLNAVRNHKMMCTHNHTILRQNMQTRADTHVHTVRNR